MKQVLGKENITVTSGYSPRSCTKQVVKRGCDKYGFRLGNKRFRCDAVSGKKVVRFEEHCPLSVGVYQDNVRCRAVRDDTLIVGCDFVV